jgi:hypothetical protein
VVEGRCCRNLPGAGRLPPPIERGMVHLVPLMSSHADGHASMLGVAVWHARPRGQASECANGTRPLSLSLV